MNTFQKFLTDKTNKHIVWEIIKLIYPNVEDKYISNKGVERSNIDNLRISKKYDWFTIDGNVCVGYNEINKTILRKFDFAINFEMLNPNGNLMTGTGWTLKDFQKCLSLDSFKIWGFVYSDDRELFNSKSLEINTLFKKLKVPKPTAKELFNYYYED